GVVMCGGHEQSLYPIRKLQLFQHLTGHLESRHVLNDRAKLLAALVLENISPIQSAEPLEQIVEDVLEEVRIVLLLRRVEKEALVLEDDLREAQVVRQTLDVGSDQEMFDLAGEVAEAVDELVANGIDRLRIFGFADPAVDVQPLDVVGDILLRDIGILLHVDHRFLGPGHVLVPEYVAELLLAQFLDGFIQDLVVRLEPDVIDEAALLSPEQVAGSPDIHVPHRQIESAAQIAELLHRLKALPGLAREPVDGRDEQIAERLSVRAPDAPAKLMKLRQSEAVRAVDDDGVGVRDVEPVLD